MQVLLRAEPQEVKSNYGTGTDYKYPLIGGDFCYVPPMVERLRQEKGILQGEPFVICKVLQGKEQRWRVERVGQAPAKQTAPQNTQPTNQLSVPSTQASTADVRGTAMSRMVAASWISAIDGIDIAREYAASKGIVLKPSDEDYRTSANTVFIQMFKQHELDLRYGNTAPASGGEKWRQ
jgi:hypothetical protein